MFGYDNVRVEVIGDPLGVERAFRERDEIQMRHMAEAMVESLEHLKSEWKEEAPTAVASRLPNPKFPTWEARTAGTYKESIQIDPPKPFEGNNLVGGVFSDDTPVANVLEHGSGLYRTGPGSKRLITPTGGRKKLAFPNPDNTRSGATFMRSFRGHRPRHIARTARIASAPFTRLKFKEAAKLAALEIKSKL